MDDAHAQRLMTAALLSIALALWVLALHAMLVTDALSDIALRVRLVGVSLRHMVPASPDDLYTPPAPQAPAYAMDADPAPAGEPAKREEREAYSE